jgi:single-strand DNA-binding protein
MNLVILVGRLGKDPDIKYTPSGSMVASFNIATDEQYKDKNGEKVKKTEWHNITVFGKLAEICGNYLHKGSKILCIGKTENQSWEKDGEKKYKTVVIMEKMEMLDSKKQTDGQQDSGQAPLEDVPLSDLIPF